MDLESESESDGGMQLDEVSMDSSSEGEADPGQNTRLDIDNSHPEGWDIVGHIETPRRHRFSHRAPDPTTTTYNQSGRSNVMQIPTSYEKDTRMRSHLREEKHAALCVLQDKEMLITYALAANETIPQTRRRFMAKYLAPNDPERAEELYAPRFWIPAEGEGGEASLVQGRYREVIGGSGDHGWCKPGYLKRMEGELKGGSRSVSAGSVSGANSPRRASGVRLASGSGRSSGRSSLARDEDDDL
ncbi:hypothetical protein N7452_006125 [Penicillium brevicompactum]|uniref:Uncharacterized protein n=1 Tax=Penicillium brevicompactum TaxID=5074 RepID=A0A9W9UFT1_PENBR|nr:hypothetical protein N7452_006125 [Penicillium brevicompactum]